MQSQVKDNKMVNVDVMWKAWTKGMRTKIEHCTLHRSNVTDNDEVCRHTNWLTDGHTGKCPNHSLRQPESKMRLLSQLTCTCVKTLSQTWKPMLPLATFTGLRAGVEEKLTIVCGTCSRSGKQAFLWFPWKWFSMADWFYTDPGTVPQYTFTLRLS